MIEIKNVSKEFEKIDNNKKKIKFLADKDITFNVKDGEILGLLGPNGAGKTTLLRVIAGIMKPTNGEIIIDDKTYDKDEIEIKSKISFLSGNTKLYKDLSPVELLKMCASYYNIPKDEVDDRINDAVKRFDMESFKNQRIGSLSTGQLQRVGVSRCVLHDPHYYILDFIKKERDNGKCIIYSTHYMEEAENICDRVVLINKGVVIANGTTKKIEKDTNTTNIRDAFLSLIEGDNNEME